LRCFAVPWKKGKTGGVQRLGSRGGTDDERGVGGRAKVKTKGCFWGAFVKSGWTACHTRGITSGLFRAAVAKYRVACICLRRRTDTMLLAGKSYFDCAGCNTRPF
ncbi:unnamed protein product, partial [Ectocarpus sp. 12 AP-2014]